MTKLGGLISGGLSEGKSCAPAEMSARAGGLPEELESFDVEGWSPYFFLRKLGYFAYFKKSLGVYGTEYLGRITTSLCLKVKY